jgi:hypothetical protein
VARSCSDRGGWFITWAGRPIGGFHRDVSRLPAGWSGASAQIEVAQQCDLSAMVQHLAIDMQDERGHGAVRERSFRGAARLRQTVATERAHSVSPGGVEVVQLIECLGSCAGVLEFW